MDILVQLPNIEASSHDLHNFLTKSIKLCTLGCTVSLPGSSRDILLIASIYSARKLHSGMLIMR